MFVDSCDGVFSDASSKRFEREVNDFLRGLCCRYIFEVVLFDSEGSCNEAIGV